ncbi:hypothetical protein JCM11251_001863 [Rhodosporidiobolus azoricus]
MSASQSAGATTSSPTKATPSSSSTKEAPTTTSAKEQSAGKGESAAAAVDGKEDEVLNEVKASKKDDKTDGEAAKEDDDDKVDVGPPSSGSVVDMEVFGQLLEIDDDESHEFSKTLAFDYITQAESTFIEIEEALASRSLDDLSKRGHFLKGSSAALGLQRVQHSCEAMQHFGKRRDARGEGPEVSEDEALARCRVLLKRLRKEQEEAKEWLEGFYKTK